MSGEKSVSEAIGELTGFDELAIQKHFGASLDELNPSMTIRALVFVQERLGGLDDKAAYGAAMRLTLKATSDRFADPGDTQDEGKA